MRRIAFLFLVLLFTVSAFATAPAFDAASSLNQTTATSPWSWSHTCTGSDLILLVGVSYWWSSTPNEVTGITYNSVALTRVGGVTNTSSNRSMELWRLVSPATGSHTISVSWTNSMVGVGGAQSWTGVHQTSPLGTFASGTGGGTTPSVDVSSATDEVVIDHLALENGVSTLNVGSGQTQRWQILANPETDGGGSSEPGATTVTMSWSTDISIIWAIGGVSLKPAGGGGGSAVIKHKVTQ
jgi:hypothetical protein